MQVQSSIVTCNALGVGPVGAAAVGVLVPPVVVVEPPVDLGVVPPVGLPPPVEAPEEPLEPALVEVPAGAVLVLLSRLAAVAARRRPGPACWELRCVSQ